MIVPFTKELYNEERCSRSAVLDRVPTVAGSRDRWDCTGSGVLLVFALLIAPAATAEQKDW